MKNKNRVRKSDLLKIPGVGISIAGDLNDLGITRISDLKNRNPEKLYRDLGIIRKTKIDRCVLYVFRSAVYFASNEKHQPELLKWWNWKDDKI